MYHEAQSRAFEFAMCNGCTKCIFMRWGSNIKRERVGCKLDEWSNYGATYTECSKMGTEEWKFIRVQHFDRSDLYHGNHRRKGVTDTPYADEADLN